MLLPKYQRLCHPEQREGSVIRVQKAVPGSMNLCVHIVMNEFYTVSKCLSGLIKIDDERPFK